MSGQIVPRNVWYRADGSGRDNYIGINSGGLRNDYQPLRKQFNASTKIDRYTDMTFNLRPVNPSDLKIVNAGVKYFGDGSGRDGYVVNEYGGTVNKFHSRGQLLRDYKENKVAYQSNR